jgi:hypothetical protein
MAQIKTSNCMKTLIVQEQQLLIRVPLPTGEEVQVIVRPCVGTRVRSRLQLTGPPGVTYETVPRDAPGSCTVPVV